METQTILSLEQKVSLEDQSQNRAQYSISSDTNDTNDILHTSIESRNDQRENPTMMVDMDHEDNDVAITIHQPLTAIHSEEHLSNSFSFRYLSM